MITKSKVAALVFKLGLAGAVLSGVVGGVVGFPGEARAEGALLAPSRLAPAERTRLTADIAAARAAHPEAFKALAEVRRQLPALDESRRGRMASVTPLLKRLGADALYPMLDQLAVEGGARGELTETAWLTWRVSLLEATGMLRDARTAPVLTAILDAPATDFEVMREAASALGKLGTDAAATKLTALAATEGPKQAAVLAGMGACRRHAVARALAASVAKTSDQATLRHVVHALGDVGSAWAWKTPVISASGEETATRAEAAKALVSAFVAHDGEVRRAAATAILVVDDPSTPALIQASRQNASPETLAALDTLARRFAASPLRRKP
ncbi:hypothetical protein [Chondromyces apiculatus]|uniref:HEAT repeat protein n=1 Tax=Chondromyces apiculatus DSM 436 TaxID=1192034 RepID=A0A017SVE3_9BACT|nr:hypothetical protein [Chondromyces apiculatus]EYF00958.1 Hypothetical protein CAP_8826 [Chondromyces apiculatus DSM 436]